MKKLVTSLVVCATLGFSFAAIAQGKIIIKQTPVLLEKQGEVYVAPSGTTTQYYSYTDSGAQYTCTTVPVDISEVSALPLAVTVNGTTTSVNCYPSTYFVVSP
jgi:hypothetical protein